MEINVNMADLADVIKKFKKIPKETTLSILDNLYVEADGSGIRVIANFLMDAIQFEIEGEVIEPGKILIDKKTLLLLDRIKSKGKVFLSKGKIICQNRQIEFYVEEDVEDYPLLPECNKPVFSANSSELKRLLGVVYASDKKEKRSPAFCSVIIDKDHFVASDTYRVATRKFDFKNKLDKPVLLPTKSASFLLWMLKNNKQVDVFADNKRLCFQFENIKYVARLLSEAPFPWRDIMERHHKTDTIVKVDRNAILKELNLVKMVTEKPNYSIVLWADDGCLHAKGEEIERALTVSVPILDFTGEEMDYKVVINSMFLIEMIKEAGDKNENVGIGFNGPLGMVIVEGDMVANINPNIERKKHFAGRQ